MLPKLKHNDRRKMHGSLLPPNDPIVECTPTLAPGCHSFPKGGYSGNNKQGTTKTLTSFRDSTPLHSKHQELQQDS